jgi:uncharacterized membrane protein YgaE (UPF0421/DUF939 family)
MENKNWITTLVGVLIAVLVAAQPILETGAVNFKSLILAVGIAVFGYFTQTKSSKK